MGQPAGHSPLASVAGLNVHRVAPVSERSANTLLFVKPPVAVLFIVATKTMS